MCILMFVKSVYEKKFFHAPGVIISTVGREVLVGIVTASQVEKLPKIHPEIIAIDMLLCIVSGCCCIYM